MASGLDQATFDELVDEVRRGFSFGDFSPRKMQEWRHRVYSTNYLLNPGRQAELLRRWIEESGEPGGAAAWDGLSHIAREYLRTPRGRAQMPAPLAHWIADVLAGNLLRPREDRTWNARDHLIRDAIEHVAKTHNLSATRNDSRGKKASAIGGSGCDVVAAATQLAYQTVLAIWKRSP